jgi:hypothetical protein
MLQNLMMQHKHCPLKRANPLRSRTRKLEAALRDVKETSQLADVWLRRSSLYSDGMADI